MAGAADGTMTEDDGFSLQQLTTIPVWALYLGARIHVRALEKRAVLALAPLTLRVGGHGCAVVFRHGAAVFFNVAAAEEADLIGYLRPFLVEPRPQPEHEEIVIRVGAEGGDVIQGGEVLLAAVTLQHLQLMPRCSPGAWCSSITRGAHGAQLRPGSQLFARRLARRSRAGRGRANC